MEHADGKPVGFRSDFAASQQLFIQFLRAENARDDEFLGWTSKLFAGSQYAVLYKATAAFLASRSVPANIGVGFVDESGKYQMLILEAERQADAEAATH